MDNQGTHDTTINMVILGQVKRGEIENIESNEKARDEKLIILFDQFLTKTRKGILIKSPFDHAYQRRRKSPRVGNRTTN